MWGLITVFGGIMASFCYWLYWRWTHMRMLELAAKLPGPPALPILGNALMFMVNPEEILSILGNMFNEYGQYVKFWLGPQLNICVTNPADVKSLLSSNKINHKGPLYEILIPFIGPGILTGGPTWRNHRKIAIPAYNKKSVKHFSNIFKMEAEELVKVLVSKDNMKINIYKDIVHFTTQCVNQTLMGLSKEDSENVYRLNEMIAQTPRVYNHCFAKMTRWWLQIPIIFWWVGGKKEENYLVKLIDDFTGDVLEKRRKAMDTSIPDEEVTGIVDRYIISGELSEQEIKWETMSLFTTSQEAAAKITSGLLVFLSHLPEWQERVYNEIIDVVGHNESVTAEHLKELHCLDMVYKETLRYLSIAAMIQRTVDEEITINNGKITLPVGTSLVIPIHLFHRDPRYWEDPLKVQPERFSPENIKHRDPDAFVPFSIGPMDCLGRVYATALIKTFVVHILREIKLQPVGTLDDIKLHVAISVSIANGYNIGIHRRERQLP